MKNLNTKRVCCAIIKKEDKVLIAKRSDGKYRGFWEFPGGKVKKDESDKNCLERELTEELGIKTITGKIFSEVNLIPYFILRPIHPRIWKMRFHFSFVVVIN